MTSASTKDILDTSSYSFLTCDTSTPIEIYRVGRVYSVEHLETPKNIPCQFCGNKSKLRDVRGNCVACGAVRDE